MTNVVGLPGPQGAPGINWLKAWVSTTEYEIADGVSYAGSSWIALTENVNVVPGTAPDQWDMIAQSGELSDAAQSAITTAVSSAQASALAAADSASEAATAGGNAGATAGATAGASAGATAGQTAGATAGSSAGATAGASAGQTAGATAGASAGQTAGTTAGTAAGTTAGTAAGQAAGTTAGTAAGTTAGATAGAAASAANVTLAAAQAQIATAAAASKGNYTTVALGLAGTTTGQSFTVSPSSSGSTALSDLYNNVSGAAVYVGSSPNNSATLANTNQLYNLSRTLTVTDDANWAEYSKDSNGVVFQGTDFTGTRYEAALSVVGKLSAGSFSTSSISPTTLAVGKVGNVVMSETDTQYDIVFVDKNGLPFWGSISGIIQQTIASVPDTSARNALRMYGGGSIFPSPVSTYRSGAQQNLLQTVGQYVRMRMVSIFDQVNIQCKFDNYVTGTSLAPNNDIFVAASIEYPVGSGVFYPLQFPVMDGPNRAPGTTGYVTIHSGQFAVNQPLGLRIPKGALFDLHTDVKVGMDYDTPTQQGTLGIGAIDTQTFSGVDIGVQNTQTPYRFTAPPTPDTNFYSYSVRTVHGCAPASVYQPTRAICGDSISQGANDNSTPASGIEGGYLQKACQTAGIGYVALGANGLRLYNMTTSPATRENKLREFRGCSCVLLNIGTNDLADLRTYAQLTADYATFCGDIMAMGIPLIIATVPPRTVQIVSGSDYSVANQQAANANFGPEVTGGSVWTQVNAYIRTMPSLGLATAVFDLAALVAVLNTANNTYVWNATYVSEGTHPNPAACIMLAAAIPSVIPTGL